jgi:hypothetical protein
MYDYFQTIIIFGLSLRLQETQVCSQLNRKNFIIGTFVRIFLLYRTPFFLRFL